MTLRAYRIATGRAIELFGDPVGDALIENVPLRERQKMATEEAGLTLVDVASREAIAERENKHEAFLTFPDDLFITGAMLRSFVAQAQIEPKRPAILALARTRALDAIAVTQDVTTDEERVLYPIRYEIGDADASSKTSKTKATPITIDLLERGFEIKKRMPTHVLASGEVKLTVSTKAILQIVTPLHVHLANMLSIMSRLAGFEPTGLLGVLAWVARAFAKKPTPNDPKSLPEKSDAPPKAPPRAFYSVLRKMNRIGKNCDIHPTAVLEGTVVGDNVRIGAFAYIQFSNIGDGADIGAGAIILTSSIGAGTILVTREWVSLSVVYPNVFFAPRFIQFAIVGRDAQVFPSMYFDYRLDGKPIMTWFRGKLVDAKTDFIGPIIGHRAKVAGGLALGPGRMVPNDVTVYPNELTVVNRMPLSLPPGTVVFAGAPSEPIRNAAHEPVREPAREKDRDRK